MKTFRELKVGDFIYRILGTELLRKTIQEISHNGVFTNLKVNGEYFDAMSSQHEYNNLYTCLKSVKQSLASLEITLRHFEKKEGVSCQKQ